MLMKKRKPKINLIHILLILSLFLINCLKVKKSAFDMSKPVGIFFGIFIGNQPQGLSISGTITGFTSGTLILQNNGKDDLTLTAPATQYSFNGIASGSTYSILPKSHPTGLSCKIDNLKGTITSNITSANITCSTANSSALYSLGDTTKSYWLDYVKFDGTSPLDATGTACTGTESGFYNACIHAGEFKKVSIPNFTSCDNITASDSLSAFNWKCVVSSDKSVSVISTGLRSDKGLTDLIDFTSPGSWKNITLTVLLNNTTYLTTTSSKWWDNTITVNNTGGSLNTTKTIYIINSSASATTYTIAQNKIALVSQSGIVKQSSGLPTIDSGLNNFTWVEGKYDSSANNIVLSHSNGSKFNMVRNFRARTGGATTIYTNTASSQFLNVAGTNTGGGFLISIQSKNFFKNIQTYNSSSTNFTFSSSDNIITDSISLNSGALNFSVNGSYNGNLYSNITSINSSSSAFSWANNFQSTIMNLLAANTGGTTSAVDNSIVNSPKFINLIAAHSGSTSQYAEANTTSSLFYGLLKVSGSGTCTVTSATTPGISASCSKISPSETTPTATTNITLSNSFVGVGSDSKNTSNTSGSQSYASITDWFNFDNQFRGWGKQGTFPTSAITGSCSGASTCSIWDVSLKSNDSAARNVNSCPSGSKVDTHQWSDNTAPNQTYCDTNYKGSIISGTTCITTFLRNAIEILGDGVGNENGICESNEECLYTPNIGAYQGHSSDSSNPAKLVKADTTSSTNVNNCPDIGSGSTIVNVTLWKYDTNGY